MRDGRPASATFRFVNEGHSRVGHKATAWQSFGGTWGGMNLPPSTPPVPAPDWDLATCSVNAWRGTVLHHFAVTECAVTETLARLAGCGDRGARVRLRHLIGQRFQDLQDAIDADGPFAVEGGAVLETLKTFRAHEYLRTVLGRGSTRIALDRGDRWIVEMKVSTFRGRMLERTSHFFEQEAAEALLLEIRQAARRLSSKLATLRTVAVL